MFGLNLTYDSMFIELILELTKIVYIINLNLIYKTFKNL